VIGLGRTERFAADDNPSVPGEEKDWTAGWS
jgi:hypothetical protein